MDEKEMKIKLAKIVGSYSISLTLLLLGYSLIINGGQVIFGYVVVLAGIILASVVLLLVK